MLVDDLDPSRILGFYTLSAAQVDARHLNETDRKRLARYPIPCFRIGLLACRSDHQGRGFIVPTLLRGNVAPRHSYVYRLTQHLCQFIVSTI